MDLLKMLLAYLDFSTGALALDVLNGDPGAPPLAVLNGDDCLVSMGSTLVDRRKSDRKIIELAFSARHLNRLTATGVPRYTAFKTSPQEPVPRISFGSI